MPRNPERPTRRMVYPNATRETLLHLVNPLSTYAKCESPAFIRRAINHARDKDLVKVAQGVDLLPTSDLISLSEGFRRSKDKIIAMEKNHIKPAATIAATSLRNARVFFEQAAIVTEEVRPILYYYGALSFFAFITSVIVRREREDPPGHGVSVSCGSDGSDFNKDWARDQCRVKLRTSGDFPFIVDSLTLGGWPSLFSSFRLYKDTKTAPWELKKNPAPLFELGKMSLDYLCNFNRQKYLDENPDLNSWLPGGIADVAWDMTTFLMDFLIVFIASNLARYYIPAWQAIVEAEKSSIYNDIRLAFSSISEELPHYFGDKHPFKYSFGTRIGG